MSLRSRLIVAFLLLSVVPLSAVTFVTYRSWVNTFESAAQREASQSAIDIGRRMERITSDVGRRMDRMFVETRGAGGTAPESAAMRQRVAPMLSDAAALVERMEFQQIPPPAVPPPAGNAPAPPAPGPPPLPPWIGPDGQPRYPPPPDGRFGRGRGGPPWAGRGGPPPVPPQVIVVDVEKAIEEAKQVARTEVAAAAAQMAPLVEESLTAALPAAQAALSAAAHDAAAGAGAEAAREALRETE